MRTCAEDHGNGSRVSWRPVAPASSLVRSYAGAFPSGNKTRKGSTPSGPVSRTKALRARRNSRYSHVSLSSRPIRSTHSTHAHSAEADGAVASRHQNVVTRTYGQRLLINSPLVAGAAGGGAAR